MPKVSFCAWFPLTSQKSVGMQHGRREFTIGYGGIPNATELSSESPNRPNICQQIGSEAAYAESLTRLFQALL